MTFDCQTCGACCTGPVDPEAAAMAQRLGAPFAGAFVNCTKLDVWRMRKRDQRQLIPVSNGTTRMLATRQLEDGRCGFLSGTVGESVSCHVYAQRPVLCRKFEAGSEHCLAARSRKGLPT